MDASFPILVQTIVCLCAARRGPLPRRQMRVIELYRRCGHVHVHSRTHDHSNKHKPTHTKRKEMSESKHMDAGKKHNQINKKETHSSSLCEGLLRALMRCNCKLNDKPHRHLRVLKKTQARPESRKREFKTKTNRALKITMSHLANKEIQTRSA